MTNEETHKGPEIIKQVQSSTEDQETVIENESINPLEHINEAELLVMGTSLEEATRFCTEHADDPERIIARLEQFARKARETIENNEAAKIIVEKLKASGDISEMTADSEKELHDAMEKITSTLKGATPELLKAAYDAINNKATEMENFWKLAGVELENKEANDDYIYLTEAFSDSHSIADRVSFKRILEALI